MYRRKTDTREDNMRRSYTPPPGYRGSRFVDRDGEVRAMEDSDYTLSVGGIPTGKGKERTAPRRGIYSSPKPSRTDKRRENHYVEDRRANDRHDDHRHDRRYSREEDEDRFRRTGGRISPVETEEEIYTADEYTEEDSCEACGEPVTFDEPDTHQTSSVPCSERICDHDAIPTPRRDCDEAPQKCDHCDQCESGGSHTEKPSLLHLFGDSGDLLLILLIILLSGEKETGNLVLILAILLAIR